MTDFPVIEQKEKRFPKKRRRLLVISGLILSLVAAGMVIERQRMVTPKEAINPMFWVRYLKGEDLFDERQALLLHGNRSLPEVALTFDDGPHPEGRSAILDILKKYGIHATFFDVGKRIEERPDLVLRSEREGHEIANHSMYHNRLPKMNAKSLHREINDADIAYCEVTSKHLRFFRPPGMQYDEVVLAELKAKGYLTVSYSALAGDFDEQTSPDVIAERIVHNTRNGAIILLHDYAPTVRALPTILDKLKAEGYRFVTLSEMVSHLPRKPRLAAQKLLSANL